MKKHLYLALLLLSAIGLGLLGCSEEDIFEESRAQEINGIISQFSPEAFGKVVSGDYKVDWDVFAPLEHSDELGLDYYEFEINLSESQAPITNRFYDTKQSLLAIKREGGKYDFYVAKYFMDRWKSEGRSVRDVSFSKMEGFSGLLNVFDSGNGMVHAKRMDNGRVLGAPLSLNSGFGNDDIENRMVEDCETVATYHYIDSYLLSYEGQWVYQYTELVNISYETECNLEYFPDLDLGGGGGSGTYFSQNGGAPYANCGDPVRGCLYKIELELEEEIILDPTFVNTKAECVYNKLSSASSGFKGMIQKFDGEFPVAHLKFTAAIPSNPNENAATMPPSNYIIEIKINPNRLNRPNLAIARTIVHETIHAEMWRKIMSLLDNGADLDGLKKTEWEQKLSNGDYPGIFDYYTRFGVAGFQHEQMAEHYRNSIVSILKEFEPGLSNDIYEALAWVGLKNTLTWNSLTSLEQNQINTIISNFNQNGNKNCN